MKEKTDINGKSNNIRSIERAFEVLECINEFKDGATLSEISRRTMLGKSTVFNILSTLKDLDYVKQSGEKGSYSLGIRLLALGQTVKYNIDVRRIAHPYMEELANKYQVTVHLGQLMEWRVLYIDKVDIPGSVSMMSRIGWRGPIYCTGIGKALLSGCADAEIKTYLANENFEKRTKYTITDPDKLFLEIEQIRKEKLAYDREEIEEGLSCVAVPIFDYKGNIAAAFSVTCTTAKLKSIINQGVISEIRRVGHLISAEMGYREGVKADE